MRSPCISLSASLSLLIDTRVCVCHFSIYAISHVGPHRSSFPGVENWGPTVAFNLVRPDGTWVSEPYTRLCLSLLSLSKAGQKSRAGGGRGVVTRRARKRPESPEGG